MQVEFAANARLRFGVWSIVAILLLYLYLVIQDASEAEFDRYSGLRDRAASVSGVIRQQEWLDRARDTSSVRAAAESRFWSSRSEGLAQATFETWLAREAKAVRAENVRIQMLPVESRNEVIALWKVSARVQFDFNPLAMQRLLYKMEGHSKLVTVDSLVLRNDRRKNVDLVVTAWFSRAND